VDAQSGDVLTLYFEGTPHDFRIARVIEDLGGASLGPDASNASLVTSLDVARRLTDREGELDSIAISLRGGVRDTLDRSEAVERQVEAYLKGGEVRRISVG
jgi:hypothetical protein